MGHELDLVVYGISWDGRITRRPVPLEDGSHLRLGCVPLPTLSVPDWECEFAVKIKFLCRSMRRKYFALQHQGSERQFPIARNHALVNLR